MKTSSARLTQKSGTNFYYAFLLLPKRKRQAIFALYSFCRRLDDCVDEADGGGEAGLQQWMDEVGRAYQGVPTTDLGRDLAETLFEFPIPRSCFEEIAAGCRMDLHTARYRTYDDLAVYCRRVASAVGLATIEIFGYENPATRAYAVELGLALQLTNILRDVAADAARGRLYLPLEDLARFGLDDAQVMAAAAVPGPASGSLAALLRFEADRAEEHYTRARQLLPAEDRRRMLSAEVMGAIYHALLREVVARGFPLGPGRVRVSRPRKAWIALRTLVANRLGARRARSQPSGTITGAHR
jgi:15-cis-phytoene synthase